MVIESESCLPDIFEPFVNGKLHRSEYNALQVTLEGIYMHFRVECVCVCVCTMYVKTILNCFSLEFCAQIEN